MKAKTKKIYRILQAHFTALTLLVVFGLSLPVAAALSVTKTEFSAQVAAERAATEHKQAEQKKVTVKKKQAAAKAEAVKQEAAKQASVQAQAAAEQAKVQQAEAAKVAQQQAAAAALPKPIISAPVAIQGISGRGLYVDPFHQSLGRPVQITSQPIARWFGDWNDDITGEVNEYVSGAAANGQLGVIVAYNIPARDCGGYSAGGVSSYEAYRTWIRGLAAGIGNRQVMVILEPDALAAIDCLSAGDQQQRLANLSDAVNVLATTTNALVYIDAGNATWQSTGTMVSRLQQANVAGAQGFALNVSNFLTTGQSASYGASIASQLGKRFVIDTSRNGNGPAPGYAWCNPAGRALGARPTTSVGEAYLDAYLWIKFPGESDGTCNGGPTAGEWFGSYAQELITNAGY